MKEAEIDNDFIYELMEKGLIFEHKPKRFKKLSDVDKEVIVLK